MFGLALGTTGAWALVDAAWLGGREKPAYRAWVRQFATWLFVASAAWCVVAGGLYVAAEWYVRSLAVFFSPWPMALLTILTSVATAGPMAWMLARKGGEISRLEASLVALGQVGVLAVNAIARQLVQNAELRQNLDLDPQQKRLRTGRTIVSITRWPTVR